MMRRLLWLHGSSPKRYQHRVGLNYRIKTYQRMLNTNVHDYVSWEPSTDSKDIILSTPLHLELRAAAWLIPKNGPKLVTTAVVIVIVIVVVEEWMGGVYLSNHGLTFLRQRMVSIKHARDVYLWLRFIPFRFSMSNNKKSLHQRKLTIFENNSP
jgi:hypothetical protein